MPLIQQALIKPKDLRGNCEAKSLQLYSRAGLVRYIMCCSQSVLGGFRDKPHK